MTILLGILAAIAGFIALVALFALPAIGIAHFGLGAYPALRGYSGELTDDQVAYLQEQAAARRAQWEKAKTKPQRVVIPGIQVGYVQPQPPRDNWLRQGDSYPNRDT